MAFVPDANFLEDINRPFEMFEAVELADGVDFSEMEDQTLPVEEEMHDVENKIQSAPSEEPESTSESETEQVSVTVPNVENTDVAEERSEISEKTDPIQHRPIIVEHDPIVIQPHTAVPSSDGDDYESDEIPDDYPGEGKTPSVTCMDMERSLCRYSLYPWLFCCGMGGSDAGNGL